MGLLYSLLRSVTTSPMKYFYECLRKVTRNTFFCCNGLRQYGNGIVIAVWGRGNVDDRIDLRLTKVFVGIKQPT